MTNHFPENYNTQLPICIASSSNKFIDFFHIFKIIHTSSSSSFKKIWQENNARQCIIFYCFFFSKQWQSDRNKMRYLSLFTCHFLSYFLPFYLWSGKRKGIYDRNKIIYPLLFIIINNYWKTCPRANLRADDGRVVPGNKTLIDLNGVVMLRENETHVCAQILKEREKNVIEQTFPITYFV